MSNRDTYKYHLKRGNKIIQSGITDDLERREQEHQQKHPTAHIKQVGRKTTEDAARDWEHNQSKGTPQQAKRDRIEVVTHGKDGRIRDSVSYGRDPMPPRDRIVHPAPTPGKIPVSRIRRAASKAKR